jgi:hypothetical protein
MAKRLPLGVAAVSFALGPFASPAAASASSSAAPIPSVIGDWRADFEAPDIAPFVALLEITGQNTKGHWVGVFCTGETTPTDCTDVKGTVNAKRVVKSNWPSGTPLVRVIVTPSGSAMNGRVYPHGIAMEWWAESFVNVTPPGR